MGLTGQDVAGLEFGCVECKVLLHRYCSCRDPGFASATCAAKTGIRRVDVVFQRGFEDGLTRGEFHGVSRAGQRDGHVGLGKSSTCVGCFVPRNSSRCIRSVGTLSDARSSRIVVTRSARAAQVPPVDRREGAGEQALNHRQVDAAAKRGGVVRLG